jgi:hypothetical protein
MLWLAHSHSCHNCNPVTCVARFLLLATFRVETSSAPLVKWVTHIIADIRPSQRYNYSVLSPGFGCLAKAGYADVAMIVDLSSGVPTVGLESES